MIARSVVTILTVLLLGATLVYLLAPSPLQLAAMKAREGQYGEARTAYEELLAQRGRTRAIVLPLADIYVGAGEDELARELLRAYVQANPGDSVVAERFADLLGDNQFVDERIQVLRMIAENTDDVSVWRELEMLYDLRNLPDERTEALWEIAQGGDATLDEFNELARLLAARNDRERALAVSLRALRSRPNSITLDGAEFHVALALALDRGDLADEAIEAWNGAHEIPGDTLTFANILENMGAPDLALRLIEQSTAYEEGNTVLRLNALRLRAAAGDPTAAFDQLLAWQAQGNLPAAGYALITELGATLGRSDEVLAALGTVRLSSLPLNTQLAAVELGTVQVNNELLEAWRAEAGEDWRGLPPLTGANLALGLGDTENGANLATRALEEAVTDADRANAARALASVGLTQQAGETITALSNEQAQNTLDADALGPLAEAALTLGRSNTALSAAEPLANSSAAPYDQALHARALSAAGRPREALDILDRLNTGDPAVEPSLMAALLGAGERERLQALVYQRLADPNLSRQRRNDLLNLLVDSAPLRAGAEGLSSGIAAELRNGGLSHAEQILRVRTLSLINPLSAVPFAGVLANGSNADDVVLYASLLMRAGRADDAYNVLAGAARSARTAEKKSRFVESLIAIGGIEAALPLLAQLAESDGSEWHYAYESALEQLGRREALAQALVRHAQDPATSTDERRELAFALLEIDHKDDAETIFQALAAGAGPTSPYTQNLVWLWGPRPDPQELQWMIDAARQAPAQERVGWIERILEAGAPQEAAMLAEEMLKQSNDPGMLDVAIRAYVVLDDRQSVERLLLPAVERLEIAASAEYFARLAEEASAEYVASLLYEKAARLEPQRNESLGKAGILSAHLNQVERARPLLSEYVGRGGKSPEALFALAEYDYEDGNLSRARTGFEAAIAASNRAPNNPIFLRLKALSLLRLRQEAQAYDAFVKLIALTPNNLETRAYAGAALMDAGRLDDAARILRYSTENTTEILRR